MKNIKTLIPDIINLFNPKETHTVNIPSFEKFADGLYQAFTKQFKARDEDRKPELFMSNVGRKCKRQVWYMMNKPHVGEKLRPETYMKFLFGDIYEALLLFLAREAGHTVEGEQDSMVISDVRGRRDAVIDGHLVDVKSASSRSFDKFNDGRLSDGDDPFGYIDQLNLYLHSAKEDKLVSDKDTASFFVVDKQMGKLALSTIPKNNKDYPKEIANLRELVANPTPPERPFVAIPDGKSGNMKLGVNCSYCDFKNECWPELRTFLYSNGPRFLTNVERVPDVPELTTNS